MGFAMITRNLGLSKIAKSRISLDSGANFLLLSGISQSPTFFVEFLKVVAKSKDVLSPTDF